MIMGKILERYIAKTIILSTIVCSLLVLAILFLLSFLTEFKNIGEGDYGFFQAVFYVFARLPNELYQFSPMLILLGSITGLSILANHRELSVMRTSGFSIRSIIASVLTAAFLLTLFMSGVGESIGPHLSAKAEVQKENAQNAGQAVVTAAGVWFHVNDNFIHVEHIVGRHLLEGVTRYEFNNHILQAAYFIKRLSYQNKTWQMQDAVKTIFLPDRTKTEKLANGAWDVRLNENLLNVGVIDPKEMPLPKLVSFARYLEHNRLQSGEYWFDFWQRLLQPFASLVMVFLAIPFVLSTVRRELPMGWRIMIGIIIGFIFFILNALLGQVAIVYQVPSFLAAVLPLLLFSAIAFMLCKSLIRN